MKNLSWLFLLGFLASCSNAPFSMHSTSSVVPPVQITLANGQIKTPVSFTLASYQCKKITLQTNQNSQQIKACYREKTVNLDSALFHLIPLWKQGFTYRHVSSNNLNDADIMIQSNV